MPKPEAQTTPDLSKVTRVEVIGQAGHSYVNYKAVNGEVPVQDKGRTLKVFCRGKS